MFNNSFTILCDIFNSIHNTYKYILNSNIEHINLYKYELEKTDIMNKLLIILSVLKVIIYKYNKIVKNSDIDSEYEIVDYNILLKNCPETLKISIISLLDIIKKIKFNFYIINDKINKYNNSYIKILIKVDICDNIEYIKMYNNILNEKMDLLFNLLNLYKINLEN